MNIHKLQYSTADECHKEDRPIVRKYWRRVESRSFRQKKLWPAVFPHCSQFAQMDYSSSTISVANLKNVQINSSKPMLLCSLSENSKWLALIPSGVHLNAAGIWYADFEMGLSQTISLLPCSDRTCSISHCEGFLHPGDPVIWDSQRFRDSRPLNLNRCNPSPQHAGNYHWNSCCKQGPWCLTELWQKIKTSISANKKQTSQNPHIPQIFSRQRTNRSALWQLMHCLSSDCN